MLWSVWQPETAVKHLAQDLSSSRASSRHPCARFAMAWLCQVCSKTILCWNKKASQDCTLHSTSYCLCSPCFKGLAHNPLLHAALFGMISRSSSRGGDVRPTGASDPAAGRAGSTIILASPRELEMVRSHNSQLVPGETPAQAYVPSPLGSMGGLAQAVINRVRGVRAGQESPRADTGRRSMSLLSRSGFRRDSCPTTPLAGVGSSQDPSSTFGTSLPRHLPAKL